MARDLAPEVERLIQFRDPNIRKKVNCFLVHIRGLLEFIHCCFCFFIAFTIYVVLYAGSALLY